MVEATARCSGEKDELVLRLVRQPIGYSFADNTSRQWSCPIDSPLKTRNTDLVLNDFAASDVDMPDSMSELSATLFVVQLTERAIERAGEIVHCRLRPSCRLLPQS